MPLLNDAPARPASFPGGRTFRMDEKIWFCADPILPYGQHVRQTTGAPALLRGVVTGLIDGGAIVTVDACVGAWDDASRSLPRVQLLESDLFSLVDVTGRKGGRRAIWLWLEGFKCYVAAKVDQGAFDQESANARLYEAELNAKHLYTAYRGFEAPTRFGRSY